MIAADRGQFSSDIETQVHKRTVSQLGNRLNERKKERRFCATRNHCAAIFNISRLKTDAEIYDNFLRIRKLFLILAFPSYETLEETQTTCRLKSVSDVHTLTHLILR